MHGRRAPTAVRVTPKPASSHLASTRACTRQARSRWTENMRRWPAPRVINQRGGKPFTGPGNSRAGPVTPTGITASLRRPRGRTAASGVITQPASFRRHSAFRATRKPGFFWQGVTSRWRATIAINRSRATVLCGAIILVPRAAFHATTIRIAPRSHARPATHRKAAQMLSPSNTHRAVFPWRVLMKRCLASRATEMLRDAPRTFPPHRPSALPAIATRIHTAGSLRTRAGRRIARGVMSRCIGMLEASTTTKPLFRWTSLIATLPARSATRSRFPLLPSQYVCIAALPRTA